MPDDIDRHLAAVRHADAIAIDLEHLAVEDALGRKTLGITHQSLLSP
jgi:hypothetical protein